MQKDPTQSNNIAKKNPEKVAELVATYDKLRAETYQGQNLIVDMMRGTKPDVLVERYGETATDVMAALKGETPKNEKVAEYAKLLQFASISDNHGTILYVPEDSKIYGDTFTYTKEQGYFTSLSAAPTNAVSHEINFKASYADGQEGVLLSNGGGYGGGYTFYIQDGKLNYLYNFAGDQQKLVADMPLVAGEIEVGFRYDKKNFYEGTATLLLNGKEVATDEIMTLPLYISYDYFSIGEDVGSNVSFDYEGRFAYPGEIGAVTINLGNDKVTKNERPKHGELPR